MNTQELYSYLHTTFEYSEGNLYYKVSPAPRVAIGTVAGTYNVSNKTWQIGIKNKLYKTHRLVFLYHKGYLPKVIDHIDRNPLNNKIENLREVTHSENCFNRLKNKNNTSGYKGVSFHKTMNKWRAMIKVKGKDICLGYYPFPEDAYKAYCNYCEANLSIYCID